MITKLERFVAFSAVFLWVFWFRRQNMTINRIIHRVQRLFKCSEIAGIFSDLSFSPDHCCQSEGQSPSRKYESFPYVRRGVSPMWQMILNLLMSSFLSQIHGFCHSFLLFWPELPEMVAVHVLDHCRSALFIFSAFRQFFVDSFG
jgi:hypothetical protein